MSVKHILWDWNGTLLDDTQAALDTLNIMLGKRGLKPMTMAYYRDHFAFPVRPFYDAIGMKVRDDEWDALAREYHDIYAAQPKRLNAEAIAALERVRAAGARQSIISALRQDLLDEATRTFGVASYMESIYGVDNLDGSSKLDRALDLMTRIDGDDVVVIGDAFHDKEIADAPKVKCVLCGQGSHAAWRLAKVAPSGENLVACVRLALSL